MDRNKWLKNQWDRGLAILAVAIAALSLLLGWIGVSGAELPSEQLPYLASGGLFGLLALGIGATLWLSADIHDEWVKLDQIHEELKAANGHGVKATNLNGNRTNQADGDGDGTTRTEPLRARRSRTAR